MHELSFYTDLLGLPQMVLTGVTVTKTTIEIACTLTDTRTLCPSCGVECTVVNDRTTRRVRDLNISERAVYLLVSVRQFRCPSCGSCPTERLPFADANKSYTHRQARYVNLQRSGGHRRHACQNGGAPGARRVSASRATAPTLRGSAAPGH